MRTSSRSSAACAAHSGSVATWRPSIAVAIPQNPSRCPATRAALSADAASEGGEGAEEKGGAEGTGGERQEAPPGSEGQRAHDDPRHEPGERRLAHANAGAAPATYEVPSGERAPREAE